jgi:hypothetical protein
MAVAVMLSARIVGPERHGALAERTP